MRKIKDIQREIALLENELKAVATEHIKSIKVLFNGQFFLFERPDKTKIIFKAQRDSEGRPIYLWNGEKIIGQLHLNNQMSIKKLKIWFAEFDEIYMHISPFPVQIPQDYLKDFYSSEFVEQTL